MAFAPQPYVEHPNLRAPIALIVDDPAPCINPLWYFRHQVDREAEPAHERTIPLDFMEEWCELVTSAGVKGDFTVLPYPAGLGRIDRSLEGYDVGETRAWVELARAAIAPQFDIHCEVLTHTNALDLQTWRMIEQSEHDWIGNQDEETLADYFTAAMRILNEAGLPNHGLTQPCHYHGDESMYARAILEAEKRVNGRSVSHNFLHMDGVSHDVPPRITHLDATVGEAIVSVWCGTGDYIWNCQERGNEDQTRTPQQLADRFLTEDGGGGRLVQLLNGGGPLVLVTHWQSLYSNGSRLGLRTYREVFARIEALFGRRVEWSKLSGVSNAYLAGATVKFDAEADANEMRVRLTCPFDCDTFTFSVATPWPLFRSPETRLDGRTLEQAPTVDDLMVDRWTMRGSTFTVSLKLERNVERKLAVAAPKP